MTGLTHRHPHGQRPLVTPFRACELCTHSTSCGERLLCDSPAARQGGRPESLDVARSSTGSCGPNARHLDMPGWH
ncbi:hypothetical protein M0765_000730 [Variovorax sp. S2]|uniref:hypothetical protein n=1 Tax=Variovorax sp. S12S4 TaxID=3029170 RepID=UPI00215CA01D|nr:hypothetical protein [Variovorax sp. S12S4]MCR8956304.1 hypothetical protein [Variovorax sp. S12S4]